MNILQPACVVLLLLSGHSLATAAVVNTAANTARSSVMSDENMSFNNQLVWETPDVPYARLLATNNTAPPAWSMPTASHGTPASPKPGAAQARLAPVPVTAVPEASMYSMLLVGLGLLALSVRGDKAEKFDS